MNKTMVFFDCWDTLIRFQEKDERWTVLPLYDHCINKDEVDWDKRKFDTSRPPRRQ